MRAPHDLCPQAPGIMVRAPKYVRRPFHLHGRWRCLRRRRRRRGARFVHGLQRLRLGRSQLRLQLCDARLEPRELLRPTSHMHACTHTHACMAGAVAKGCARHADGPGWQRADAVPHAGASARDALLVPRPSRAMGKVWRCVCTQRWRHAMPCHARLNRPHSRPAPRPLSAAPLSARPQLPAAPPPSARTHACMQAIDGVCFIGRCWGQLTLAARQSRGAIACGIIRGWAAKAAARIASEPGDQSVVRQAPAPCGADAGLPAAFACASAHLRPQALRLRARLRQLTLQCVRPLTTCTRHGQARSCIITTTASWL